MRSQVISCSDPWEEQSFYLDSCDPSDQFVWFPRSYLCSFCNREFKSAQALGGHMNVHRRDRAMLKPSSSFDERDECHHHQPMSRLEKKKTDHDFCSTFVTKSSEIEIVERSGENRWNPCSTSKFDKNQINYPLSSVTPSSTTIHEEGIDGSKLNDSLNDRRQLPSPNFVQKDKKRKRQESKVVYELHINIHEELDLELRLGDRCTVGKILKKINIS